MNLSIANFIERFYTPGSGSSSSFGGYAGSFGNSSSSSNDKTFEASNVYVKSLLKFMHILSKKLSGFNLSYSKQIQNSYSNILGDYRPGYDFKLGIEDYPIEVDKLNTIQANNSQIFSFINKINEDFTLSTALSISPKITFTNIMYKENKITTYPSNADTTITISQSYFAQGDNGKSGLPLFNWSLNINNINDFWFLDNWFNNIMLQHSFSGTKEENYINDLLKTTVFTKNFTPFAGMTFNFKRPKDMKMTLYHNNSLTITNSTSSNNVPRIDRSITKGYTFSLDWTKRKQRDLKFFKNKIQIENELSLNLDISMDDSHSDYVIVEDPNQAIEWINSTFNKSITITPGITYSFSEWIDGTFFIQHKIMETQSTNKKDESSVGFNLLIYFESKSTN